MLKATFDIIPETNRQEDIQNSLLLMEVGEKVFSYVLYNKQQQRFMGLRQYNLDFMPGKPVMEALQEILAGDELLQLHYREAFVIYHYTDSNLLPEKLFHIELNKPVTELIFGNAHKGLLLSEKVPGWNVYNIYRIPREAHALMQHKFAAGKYWHYYTIMLSGIEKGTYGDGVIKVVVASDRIVAAVFKNNALQLIQTYNYDTPDDVSYQLLALCDRFSLDNEKVILKISGLLDEQSKLYQELFKYFLRMEWEAPTASSRLHEAFEAYPAHYFSPLLNMALCV
jgi:hypothetical protein